MAPLLRQILPALRSYVGITMREPQKNAPAQAVNGRCVTVVIGWRGLC